MSVTAQNFATFTFALYNQLPSLDQMLQVLRTRPEQMVVDAFVNTIRENGLPNFGNLGGVGNLFPIPKDLVRTSPVSLAFIGDAGSVYADPMIIIFNRENGQFFAINDQRQVVPIPEDMPIRIWGFNPDPNFGAEDMDVVMDVDQRQVPVVVQSPAQGQAQQQHQQQIIDIPDYLTDLVTLDFFNDPVSAFDGDTYQRATADEMIRRHLNTNSTGERLTGPLYPNPLIKRSVADFRQNYQQVQDGRYRRRTRFTAEPPEHLINPASGQLLENPVIDLVGPSIGRTRQSTQPQRHFFAQNRRYPPGVVANANLKKAVDDYKATRDRKAAARARRGGGGGV